VKQNPHTLKKIKNNLTRKIKEKDERKKEKEKQSIKIML